jgi:rod shape-determining protein MreC
LREKRPFVFLVLAVLPLVLVLQARERSDFIHQISLTCVKPFLVASHAVSDALLRTKENLSQFWNLYREHAELQTRVETLERELVNTEELEKENERLRKLLDFKKEVPGKTVPARVIGRDLAPWRRTLVIDKGSTDGVKNRMAVVNAEGLVGRVVEVAPFSARVVLLLDPESRVSTIFQESRDLGVAEGDGTTWLRVIHLDREATVKIRDRVLTSGLGGIYPKGIPIGIVETVGNEKNGLELFAAVRPFVNFSKLEEVLCVTSSRDEA